MLPAPNTSGTFRRRRRNCFQRFERCCCNTITYFPLVFVCSVTTWGVWVEVQIGMLPSQSWGKLYILLGVAIYVLLNWSYLTAVFTDPGSPTSAASASNNYDTSSVTVKSTGEMRFCKKCQAKKPDRSHHCSTCRRCVLKMDHHCPWLATCVGFGNYKAFLLFLIYTSLFCWLCFFTSAKWLWHEVMEDSNMGNDMMPVHFVILSVVSGIIGLVISGFTAYHLWLTVRNRTTIESLEKTRYLSPVKSHVSHSLRQPRTYGDDENHTFGEQLRDLGNTLTEIHANALPGVLRPEEGEERMSPAQNSLRRTMDWNDYTRQRERQQYQEYLDERDSDKLPNAFDLGWRRNLENVMGRNKWLWPLPMCRPVGNGWEWEQNAAFQRERHRLREEREIEMQRQTSTEGQAGWGASADVRQHRPDAEYGLSKADRILGRQPGQFYDGGPASRPPPSKALSRLENELDDSDDEEDTDGKTRLLNRQSPRASAFDPHPGSRVMENWNDLPEDMVQGRRSRNGKG